MTYNYINPKLIYKSDQQQRQVNLKKILAALIIIAIAIFAGVQLRQDVRSKYDRENEPVLRPALSEQNKKWLKENPVIKVGVLRDAAPYEYVDPKGEVEGIAVSYMNILERSLGVEFQVVPLINWDEGIEMLRSGQVMALSFVSVERGQKMHLVLSVPYISSSLGIFTNNYGAFVNNLDDLLSQKIAIDNYTKDHRLIVSDWRHEYVVYRNSPEALAAVRSGKVGFYIGDILNTKFAIEKLRLRDLRYVAPVVGSAYSFGWGAQPENAELIRIIDKVLMQITPEQHLDIRFRWTNMADLGEGGVRNYNFRWYLLWISGVFLLILMMVLFRNRVLRKKTLQQSHSQKMESLGLLAGGVAHDFNNMLAGIQGAAEFIKMRLTPREVEKIGKYVDIIIKACRRSAHLTSQLLFLSRDKEQNFDPINFNEMVKDSVMLLEHGIPRKIVIETKFEALDCCVYANRNLVQNLLLNLGFNAKDAMPEGGEIVIKTQNTQIVAEEVHNYLLKVKPGKYLELTVQDQGGGISREIQNKIFEPFFTTKSVGKGTGLGLAAVYGIVSDHKGTIRVESSEKGTIFHIYFPVSEADVCMESEMPRFRKFKAKVMVVDDEKILLEMLKDILKSLNIEVIPFMNPLEAEDYYRQNPDFDMVILDVLMPHLSGVELYERLSLINPKVKVIFVSGYSKDNDIEKIIAENPRTRFIKKPYNVSELNEKLFSLHREK